MKSAWGGQGRDFLIRAGLKSHPHESGPALGWGFITHQERDTGRGEDRLLHPPGCAGEHVLRCARASARRCLCTGGSEVCADGARAPCGLGGARAAEVLAGASSHARVLGRMVPLLCHDCVP